MLQGLMDAAAEDAGDPEMVEQQHQRHNSRDVESLADSLDDPEQMQQHMLEEPLRMIVEPPVAADGGGQDVEAGQKVGGAQVVDGSSTGDNGNGNGNSDGPGDRQGGPRGKPEEDEQAELLYGSSGRASSSRNGSRSMPGGALGSRVLFPPLQWIGVPAEYHAICGVMLMIVVGVVLGMVTPRDSQLSREYSYLSNVLGYCYFLAWSVSFYPQIYSNWRRKSTEGLSYDYVTFNIVGFLSYAVFNLCFYYSRPIEDEYKDRHNGNSNKVQFTDVLFAVHAVVATSIVLCQIWYFDWNRRPPPSTLCLSITGVMLLVTFVYLFLVVGNVAGGEEPFAFIDWLYFLSYLKMLITLLKYIPQVLLNRSRKSTVGWNIWNVLLDFLGGALSVLQLLLDCNNTNDWSGIAGDPVKFGLGVVSMFFDAIFMVQHYILYPESKSTDGNVPFIHGPGSTASDATDSPRSAAFAADANGRAGGDGDGSGKDAINDREFQNSTASSTGMGSRITSDDYFTLNGPIGGYAGTGEEEDDLDGASEHALLTPFPTTPSTDREISVGSTGNALLVAAIAGAATSPASPDADNGAVTHCNDGGDDNDDEDEAQYHDAPEEEPGGESFL